MEMELKDFASRLAQSCTRQDTNCVLQDFCPYEKRCKDVTRADWVKFIVRLEKPEVLSIKAVCKDCEYLATSMGGMPLCIVINKTVRPDVDYCDMYEKAAQPRTANS